MILKTFKLKQILNTHIIPIKKFCLAKQTFTTRSRRTKAGMSLSSSLPFLPPSGRYYLQNHLSLDLAPFIPCLDVELYILLAYQITFKSLQQPTGLPWEMDPSTCRSPSKHSSPSRSSPLHAFQLKCFYI